MNDKDKEAFEKWISSLDWLFCSPVIKPSVLIDMKTSWQASCEYKQKEIDELQAENSELKLLIKQYEKIVKDRQDELNYLVNKIDELQSENEDLKQKLSEVWKEAEKFYLDD